MPNQLPISSQGLREIYHEIHQKNPNYDLIGKALNEGKWSHLINSAWNRSQPRIMLLVEKLNQTFARLEQSGAKVFDPANLDKAYRDQAALYRKKREDYLKISEKILSDQLKEGQQIDPKLKKACLELECRQVSLQYFLGKDNGGLDPDLQADPLVLRDLKLKAAEWKEKQKVATNHHLNHLEEIQLEELSKYPQWLKAVYEDPHYLAEVFDWCLRDYNQVEIIVKCYETRRRLKDALLSANLGYVRNLALTPPNEEVIAFKTIPAKADRVAKTILTCAIYDGKLNEFQVDRQQRINILKDDSLIHFKQGNYRVTVAEFLKELSEKNKREAKFNLCAHWGFINFDPIYGVWDQDDQIYKMPEMTEKDWLDKIPPSRIVSHAELLGQYGDKVKTRQFFFKVMATRKNLDLNALDCHAFWQLYVRMGNGDWKIFNIGIYAYRFPKSVLHGLWLFCATVMRVLCLMDQNGYYTHRQKGAIPMFPTDAQKEALLSKIYGLIHTKGVFQFTGRNCAHTVQTTTRNCIDGLPNFFFMPLTQSKSGIGPLDKILAWLDNKGEWVRWLVTSMLQILFLAHRKVRITHNDGLEENYSVKEYFEKFGYNIFNPSYLPHQIAQAKKTGQGPFVDAEFFWSHTDERLLQPNVAQI